MTTPRKQRTSIKRFNNNSPDYVREKMGTPEMTAKRLEGLRKWRSIPGNKVGRALGQQDGVRKRVYLKRLEQAKIASEKAIRLMSDKKIWVPDNDLAERAMKTAIEVMESQVGTTDARLKAAKTILEFVQTKPVVKSETTLKSAEAFLEALAEEEGNESKS